jgi:hypothetical protein
MDVSIWWVLIGAAGGMCAGMLLFAVLSMASDRDAELVSEPQAPTGS